MELFEMPRKDKHAKASTAPHRGAGHPIVIAIDFSDDSKAEQVVRLSPVPVTIVKARTRKNC